MLPSGQSLAAPSAHWAELGCPCLLGCAATCVPGLSAGPQAGRRATLPAQARASPPALCQQQQQASRALRGIPARRLPQRLLLAEGSRCPGHLLAGQLLCPVSAHLGNRHLLSKGPHG